MLNLNCSKSLSYSSRSSPPSSCLIRLFVLRLVSMEMVGGVGLRLEEASFGSREDLRDAGMESDGFLRFLEILLSSFVLRGNFLTAKKRERRERREGKREREKGRE